MPEIKTTANGHEVQSSVDAISAHDFRERLGVEYGIDAKSPARRLEQLQTLSVEGVAIFLEDINKSIQGSAGSLMNHNKVMSIGESNTVALKDRYDVFLRLIGDIKMCSPEINPARVGDVLALGVVALHPFYDGNGRTARVIGMLFRDEYDSEQYEENFNIVVEPRDIARKKGGFMINGYVPQYPQGFDQSDGAQVSAYLSGLLKEENDGAYVSCFGQAPLRCGAE